MKREETYLSFCRNQSKLFIFLIKHHFVEFVGQGQLKNPFTKDILADVFVVKTYGWLHKIINTVRNLIVTPDGKERIQFCLDHDWIGKA